jgi:ATP-dependent Clp protease ATP-binding subunit ClpB
MDMDRLTQKSQEAVQQAQDIAVGFGHSEVDGEHLLLALIDQPEGLVARLLAQFDIDIRGLRAAVESDVQRRPKE